MQDRIVCLINVIASPVQYALMPGFTYSAVSIFATDCSSKNKNRLLLT